MPIQKNVYFFQIVIFEDFFLTLKKGGKKSFFIMAAWITGNININYKFYAKEISIQRTETGRC